jgi:hypothetical protein
MSGFLKAMKLLEAPRGAAPCRTDVARWCVRKVDPGTLARARVLSPHLRCCAGTTLCLPCVERQLAGARNVTIDPAQALGRPPVATCYMHM